MNCSDAYCEMYIVTDFTAKICNLIRNKILSYTKNDIEKAKVEIIDYIIKGKKEIYKLEASKNKYEPRINDLKNLNESDLKSIIGDIRLRYI